MVQESRRERVARHFGDVISQAHLLLKKH